MRRVYCERLTRAKWCRFYDITKLIWKISIKSKISPIIAWIPFQNDMLRILGGKCYRLLTLSYKHLSHTVQNLGATSLSILYFLSLFGYSLFHYLIRNKKYGFIFCVFLSVTFGFFSFRWLENTNRRYLSGNVFRVSHKGGQTLRIVFKIVRTYQHALKPECLMIRWFWRSKPPFQIICRRRKRVNICTFGIRFSKYGTRTQAKKSP